MKNILFILSLCTVFTLSSCLAETDKDLAPANQKALTTSSNSIVDQDDTTANQIKPPIEESSSSLDNGRSSANAPLNTCKIEGKIFKSGDVFKQDCNTCSCDTMGNISCTEMACGLEPGKCEPTKVCIEKSFYKEIQCITTPCDPLVETSYGWIDSCELDLMDTQPNVKIQKVDDSFCKQTLPEAPLCETSSGKLIKPGESAMEDCNSCLCTENGLLACTKKACLPTDPIDDSKVCPQVVDPVCAVGPNNESKTFSNSCMAKIDGFKVLYSGECPEIPKDPFLCPAGTLQGESFPSPDGCNSCACTSSGVVCTLMACEIKL